MSEVIQPTSRAAATQAGVRVEAVAVVWMAIEAAVALGSGIVARSVLLTAFGFDSVIELLSAASLFKRLRIEARGGDAERIDASGRRPEHDAR